MSKRRNTELNHSRRTSSATSRVIKSAIVFGLGFASAAAWMRSPPSEGKAEREAPEAAIATEQHRQNHEYTSGSSVPEFQVDPSLITQEVLRLEATRREQAEVLLKRIMRSVTNSPHFGQGMPERAAIGTREVIEGIAMTIDTSTPTLLEPLKGAVKREMCRGASDEVLLSLAYFQSALPDLGTDEGFDCVFQQRTDEDIVTWAMLDAWRESGRPATPSIESVAARATDPRTKRRFMSAEALAEERNRLHAQQ